MSEQNSLDLLWENEIYSKNQQNNQYPFDFIVSFVYHYRDKSKAHSETSLLEVGCGVGNNLWFAAREGFRVAGIDGSSTAIELAKQRFQKDGLEGEFYVGDFVCLPIPDESFDIVIDRGALTNCGSDAAERAVSEIYRVLKPGGRFLFNPYSCKHTSCLSGEEGPDGLTVQMKAGVLRQYKRICFYDRMRIEELLGSSWKMLSLKHLELSELLNDVNDIHAEWRVVVEKTAC